MAHIHREGSTAFAVLSSFGLRLGGAASMRAPPACCGKATSSRFMVLGRGSILNPTDQDP